MDLPGTDLPDPFGAAVGVAAGYALVLAAMTALLFGLPFLLFSL